MLQEIPDQTLEHLDDDPGLCHGLWPGVDPLVVEASQLPEGLGGQRIYPNPSGLHRGRDHRVEESGQLQPPGGPDDLRHDLGKFRGGDDASMDGILQVMGAVCDPISPADEFTLQGSRCRARPGVVPDPIQGLGRQIQSGQHNISPPGAVVVTFGKEGVEGVLGGMPTWAMPAVMAQGHRLSQRNVRSDTPGHRDGALGHLKGMGETGSLMIGGVNHHLCLAREAAEGG